VKRKRGIIIAIDGPTASGKSTTAKLVANKLGFLHLNTGGMYRAFALLAKRNGLTSDDREKIHTLLEDAEINFDSAGRIALNGESLGDELMAPDIALLASELSTLADVREKLVNKQRRIGADGAVVLEGRDIGTVVFPDAELKIFLIADSSVRALRRQEELEKLGTRLSLAELKQQLEERDRRDRERQLSPLRKADDAIELDTTDLTIDGQVERVAELAMERMKHWSQLEAAH
jgi:cytidylate kinase